MDEQGTRGKAKSRNLLVDNRPEAVHNTKSESELGRTFCASYVGWTPNSDSGIFDCTILTPVEGDC